MKKIFFLIPLFLGAGRACGSESSARGELDKICDKRGGCCQRTLKIVKKGGFMTLHLNKAPSFCPEGMSRSALRCHGSLVWCEPKKENSYERAARIKREKSYFCNEAPSESCCMKSLQKIRSEGFLLVGRMGYPDQCPKGASKNKLKCQGSLAWCE